MKKICTAIVVLIFSQNLFAQQIDTLSTDKELLVKEISKLLEDTKRLELKEQTKAFNDMVKKGKLDDAFLSDLRLIVNRIILLRGKAYPQISAVLENFIQMKSLSLAPEKWSEWFDVLVLYSNNFQGGESKKVLKFLDFTLPLYEKNALYHSKAKSWYIVGDKFKLKYLDEEPVVEMELAEIIGVTKGDTLTIKNTLGTYKYSEKIFYGLHGAADWKRAGIPEKEVFCTFGEFELDVTTQSYQVDSVLFTYKNYFEKDIKGTLIDKLIIDNNSTKTSYPKFTALRKDVPLQKITPNVIYDGGFVLSGSKILGQSSTDQNSSLYIYKPGTTNVIAKAVFNNITINKPKKISISNAAISIYFEQDSIYHPRINVFFDLENNVLKLVKGEGSLAATKFFDSYHNIEFDADIVEWEISNNYIDINTVSTSGLKASTYESKDFFDKNTIKKVRGNVSYDPLSILNIHQTRTEESEILDEDYAKMLSPNLGVKQIQPLLFNLISKGFISWDQKSGIISIKSKVRHYVYSNAKRKDFDNISIISKTKKQNGRIYLDNKDLVLNGTQVVPISNETTTRFFPDSSKLTLKENRDMLFNGFFFCGRMDFFGNKNYFHYEDFMIDIPEIDTLIMNVPDGDKLDEFGKPLLRPLNTVIENLSGKLEINHPKNKSGRVNKAEYPKLSSESKSKIFFDSKNIRSGTYKRDQFYYSLNPFMLDSLSELQPGNLSFEGELFSADIFPKITQKISVQDDLSLGFHLESPVEGFDIYKGKAKFFSDITLNGKGLSGQGKIQFKTITFESSNIEFFPDSLLALTDTLGVKKSKGDYESPWVRSANNDLKFYPYQDSLWANSDAKSPFRMYGEVMDLDGTFSITDKGITGTGTADWDDATLISNHFVFESDKMFADTAELIIKSLDGDKVTFNTPNVNAAVDFIEYTGYFKSNLEDNKTEFGYNQYETNLDEFFWDINAKRLEFNAQKGSPGAPFKSLHKDQDSLLFLVKNADFNLQTSIIEAHGVDEILVADSRVIPNEGEVVINPEAKLSLFENATIEANAESKKHRIENATLEILGKNNLRGSGDYAYKTKDTEVQYINFPSINVISADSTLISKKKKQKESYFALTGIGLIEESEEFILYPDVTFFGDVKMFSSYDKLKIKGFTKIDFKSEFVSSDFYEIDSEVDPENLRMDVSKAKDPGGSIVRTGLFVSKSGLNPIYTEILNNQIGPLDIPMIETNGVLSHNYDRQSYLFGSEEKIENPDKVIPGNVLEFTPSTGAIQAEGFLNLGTQYGVIKEKVAGTVEANLNENIYSLNTSITFPFKLEKTLLDKIGFYFFEDNFDSDDSDYTDVEVQKQLAEFFKPKELEKILEEIAQTETFLKPKSSKDNLLLTNVKLNYDNDIRSYLSKGKVNLAYIGERAIHKKITAYIELGHRIGSDYYNIYLKTGLGDWLYLNFEGGVSNIKIVSSFEDINQYIESLDIKSRTIKGEQKDQFIVYEIGSESKAMDFAKRMKAYNSEE